jgi:hypothetical protein
MQVVKIIIIIKNWKLFNGTHKIIIIINWKLFNGTHWVMFQ